MRTDKDGLAELGGSKYCGRREARGLPPTNAAVASEYAGASHQCCPQTRRLRRREVAVPLTALQNSLRYLRATLRLQKNAQYAAARGPSQGGGLVFTIA